MANTENKKKTKEKELSPMMKHYKELKKQYHDSIVMYRLGDFYEMFFEDAETASRVLDLTLTGRDCGLEERAPMCGVPYHAVDGYISKLIENGYNVAICDQLSNPGDQPGIVKRDVTRVITPGTVVEDDILDAKRNNYLASVYFARGGYGIAFLDINEGEINVYNYSGEKVSEHLENFLEVIEPKEIICNSSFVDVAYELTSFKAKKLPRPKSYYDLSFDSDNASKTICNKLHVYNLASLGIEEADYSVSACGALLDYIENTQKRNLVHVNRLKLITDTSYMHLDYNTKRNLELTVNLADHTKSGSLLSVLDNTCTNMGARALRKFVEEPLIDADQINSRLDAVEELYKSKGLRIRIKNALDRVRDIERISGKISYGSVTPRECVALKESLSEIPKIKKLLENAKSTRLKETYSALDVMVPVKELIEKALIDNPPVNFKDGGVIKSGYNSELDSLRDAKTSGNEWIKDFEAKEKEKTGIKNLRIGFNKVFGYYIEVINSQKNLVPYDYIRKQTTINSERYVTEELKNVENVILGAGEKALELELKLYKELKDFLLDFVKDFQRNAKALAYLDAIASLSEVAELNGYVKPKIKAKLNSITIKDGRHPVVETFKKKNEFVPNDCLLDNKDNNVLIITGPNMAGKSTYMRQTALIVLMAQMGSFVPAASLEMGVVDRVFTRIGASDNLSQGQSTFMVEMIEVSSILSQATPNSLLVLDEIGRGTSTLDGLSIAWAIVEYLASKTGAKTLFATHYHELSEMESLLSGVKNYRILINDTDSKITFLYKIARGGASKSFGIEVAELAGVKKEIINRAKSIMNSLEKAHDVSGGLADKLSSNVGDYSVMSSQMNMFGEDPRLTALEKLLSDIDVNRITPIEALTMLSDIKKMMNRG